jgi:hypothetical protein
MPLAILQPMMPWPWFGRAASSVVQEISSWQAVPWASPSPIPHLPATSSHRSRAAKARKADTGEADDWDSSTPVILEAKCQFTWIKLAVSTSAGLLSPATTPCGAFALSQSYRTQETALCAIGAIKPMWCPDLCVLSAVPA